MSFNLPSPLVKDTETQRNFDKLKTAFPLATSLIADDAITAAKIAPDAVGSSEIAAGAVGASELADGSVTLAKLGQMTFGTVSVGGGAAAAFHTATVTHNLGTTPTKIILTCQDAGASANGQRIPTYFNVGAATFDVRVVRNDGAAFGPSALDVSWMAVA